VCAFILKGSTPIQSRKQNLGAVAGNRLRRTSAYRLSLPLIISFVVILVLGEPGGAAAVRGYIGFELGSAQSSFDQGRAAIVLRDNSSREFAHRLFGGFQFLPFVGMECAYFSLGEQFVYESIWLERPNDYFKAKMSGLEVLAVGTIPIGQSASIFAKAGRAFWNSDMEYRSHYVGMGTSSKSGSCLTYSFGAKCGLFKFVSLRTEYARYAIDKAEAAFGDVNVISAGILIELKL
jgi:OmpA-OmpF porin, OOP family